jgi:FAD:protein FMN transferase
VPVPVPLPDRAALPVLALVAALAAPSLAHAQSAAGQPRPQKLSFSDSVMGTVVDLTIWTADRPGAAAAAAAAFAELRRIDALMSNWIATSDVERINAAAGGRPVAISDETFAVLETAQDVARRSGGLFDVTVGAYRGLWKFDEDRDGTVPTAEAVRARKKLVGWRGLVLDRKKKTARLRRKGMAITLGGIAKGHAVDRAAAVLRQRGFADFIVQAGGDLYVAGSKGGEAWRVGIRDPRGARDQPFALTALRDRSFSTSGDYERAVVAGGKRYHHILDPRSGQPAMASRSVTVMAADAFTADAWSKVLFILGPDKGIPLAAGLGLEAVWVDADNRVHTTAGLTVIDGDPRQAVAAGLTGKLLILRPPTEGT